MGRFSCSPQAVRLSSMILYFLCGVMEIIGFICAYSYIDSICVTARENSTHILWTMNCILPQILPDLMFAVGGFCCVTHFYAPLGGAYNIFMAILCIVSAIFAFLAQTGCGNPAQPLALVASVFALIAGGLHIVITTLVALNLEDDDTLFSNGMFEF